MMNDPKLKRRSFRFSTLTLLIFISVAGAALGIWQKKVASIKRQWRAADPLIKAGAQIESVANGMPDWTRILFAEGRSGWINSVKFDHIPVSVKDLEPLSRLPRLRRLYLPGTNATDEHCRFIASLPKVQRLALWKNKITNKGAKQLLAMPELKVLDLHNNTWDWRFALAAKDRPDLDLELGSIFHKDHVVTTERDLVDLKSLNWDIYNLSLPHSTDVMISKALKTFPKLEQLSIVARPNSFSQVGLKALLQQDSLKETNLIFPPAVGRHYLGRQFVQDTDFDFGQNVDQELLAQSFRVLGPKTKQLVVYEHDEVLQIGFVTDKSDSNPHFRQKRFWIVIPTECLSAEEWSRMAGLESVPQIKFGSITETGIGKAAPAYGLAGATHNATQLLIEPHRPISDESLAYLARLNQLKLVWIKATGNYHDVPISEKLFAKLGCQQTLERIGLHPRMIANGLEALKDFPNFREATIGGTVYYRSNFDELLKYEQTISKLRERAKSNNLNEPTASP